MPESVEVHQRLPEWNIGPWTWEGWRPSLVPIAIISAAFLLLAGIDHQTTEKSPAIRVLDATLPLLIVLILVAGLQLLVFAVIYRNDRRTLRLAPEDTLFAGRGRMQTDSGTYRLARNGQQENGWIPSSLFVTTSGISAVPDQAVSSLPIAVGWAEVTAITSAPSGGRTLRGIVNLVSKDGGRTRFEFRDYRRLAPVLAHLQTGEQHP
jgi:hypothetical protein